MCRRPTIPLADWRIAVQLEATRAIQNQVGTPAYGCRCEACSAWRQYWRNILPANLTQQLQRVGIDLDHPTDLYAYENTPMGSSCRATFYCVGHLMSGPNTWLDLPDGSRMLDYATLRDGSDFILMAVYPHKQSHLSSPANPTPLEGELIQIDMRLRVPAGT